MAVHFGIDVLQAENFARLAGRRVGLLTNPSGVDHRLKNTTQIFWESADVNLVALFSPEHGYAAAAADAEKVPATVDSHTKLPVYSLYGDTYAPTPAMLADIDVIVCDIQDVGVRFYTYIWTITHILEAAGRHGVAVMILDRPNPLGGLTVAGPLVQDKFLSFVGRFPVPIAHGLTLGELASLVNDTWNPTPANLSIVECTGWQRSMRWQETGRVWVPPSPAIPHLSTVEHYPGACLLEGTTLSEGRGTALPFEVIGAPWIDAQVLAQHLNAQSWENVSFRPHVFLPSATKWQNEVCQGVQVHIVDSRDWQPIPVWLGVIRAVRLLYPEQFQWLPPQSTGVEAGECYHFDRLMGSDKVRQAIDSGRPMADITADWAQQSLEFYAQREVFLRYD